MSKECRNKEKDYCGKISQLNIPQSHCTLAMSPVSMLKFVGVARISQFNILHSHYTQDHVS